MSSRQRAASMPPAREKRRTSLTRADLYGEECFTPLEIAEKQGVHRRTVYRWISEHLLLNGYKIGRNWYFPRSAIEAMKTPQAVVQGRQRQPQHQQQHQHQQRQRRGHRQVSGEPIGRAV